MSAPYQLYVALQNAERLHKHLAEAKHDAAARIAGAIIDSITEAMHPAPLNLAAIRREGGPRPVLRVVS